MANTERLKALELVHLAKTEAGQLRNHPQLAPEENDTIHTIYSILDEMEEDLIFKAIAAKVSALSAACEQLKKITAPMKLHLAQLKELSVKIDKAAQAVELLVNIAEKAAKLLAL